MRTNKDKWTKTVTEWYPRNGKRQKGRQIKRWEDDLPKRWKRLTWNQRTVEDNGEAYETT